jgi:ribonuclease HII
VLVTTLDFSIERSYWRRGLEHVAGIDEAGRGPLAGPVVAAAVLFPHEVWIQGVNDSKRISPRRREELYETITACALSVGVGIVSHAVIDEINIYQATMRAMGEAVAKLAPFPTHLLIDGPRYHNKPVPHTAIVGGDARCFTIAAASIVAKVTRDRLMQEYHREFPQYGFDRHKGYGTPEHLRALRKYGPCEIHRRSFRMPEQEDDLDAEVRERDQ